MSDTRTLVSIQVLRAAAALLVLVAHLVTPFVAGAAGVDLFFVISGFVMVYSSEKLYGQPGASTRFFAHRLARIVPLYWLTSTVVLLLVLKRERFGVSDLSWATVVGSYLFVPIARPSGLTNPLHSVGWTLNFEMLFYVIFAVGVMLQRRYAVLFATLFLLLFMVVSRFLPQPLMYLGNPMLWEFIFGMTIGLGSLSGVRLRKPYASLLVAAGAGFYIWTCTVEINNEFATWRHLLWGVPAATIVAGLALADTEQPRGWGFLVLIGNASYALYLTHSLVVEQLGRFAAALPATSYPNLYVVIQLAVCVGVAIVVSLYFEKPITRYLQAKIARRTPARTAIINKPSA